MQGGGGQWLAVAPGTSLSWHGSTSVPLSGWEDLRGFTHSDGHQGTVSQAERELRIPREAQTAQGHTLDRM